MMSIGYSFTREGLLPTMAENLKSMYQQHIQKKSELLMDILNNYLGYNPPITNEPEMIEQLNGTHMNRTMKPFSRLVCEVQQHSRDETYYYIHPEKGKQVLLLIRFPRLLKDSDVWKFEYHSAFLSKDKRCCETDYDTGLLYPTKD
jgi:hypothetical protein